jgi:mono/diheme cytochrome c family protein
LVNRRHYDLSENGSQSHYRCHGSDGGSRGALDLEDDADLKAIAIYLKSLPGRSDAPSPMKPDDAAMVAGRAIYRDQCSACDALDGHGVQNLFPSLADSTMVRSDDPSSLIRIILRGARSAATEKEPTAPGMPAYGWQLSDDQLAAVATYIRNSWGAAAAPVTAREVARARDRLKQRAD